MEVTVPWIMEDARFEYSKRFCQGPWVRHSLSVGVMQYDSKQVCEQGIKECIEQVLKQHRQFLKKPRIKKAGLHNVIIRHIKYHRRKIRGAMCYTCQQFPNSKISADWFSCWSTVGIHSSWLVSHSNMLYMLYTSASNPDTRPFTLHGSTDPDLEGVTDFHQFSTGNQPILEAKDQNDLILRLHPRFNVLFDQPPSKSRGWRGWIEKGVLPQFLRQVPTFLLFADEFLNQFWVGFHAQPLPTLSSPQK